MAEVKVAARECSGSGVDLHPFENYRAHQTSLGSLKVLRALPVREKRLVGPWCFLDRFGPHSFTGSKPMDVAPHPHIGLQTVTVLLRGEIIHKDSLGHEALLLPGGVNVMTSGGGIAHAEETPAENTGILDGVQLWVALPEAHRSRPGSFEHLSDVPKIDQPGGSIAIFAGAMLGQASRAGHFSPLLGADLALRAGGALEVPLEAGFEHAALLLAGDAEIEGVPIEGAGVCYLGIGRASLAIGSAAGCRILLIGGPPFPERILMWWNFVARTPEEIAQARLDWENHERFGEVRAYRGPRLGAPPLVRLSPPNPVS